jgi:7,8-dihydropterin-6-yl-methyl-4-(beta-D-ribofuranosyl)aminobenzene 5'-phosphate synthase
MVSIHCIVDNTVQRGSTLWGEHGVSFAIETPTSWVLFDTGQSGEVLVHNAAQMAFTWKGLALWLSAMRITITLAV